MTHESTIRPIVETYQSEILEKHRFQIDRQWVELGMEDCVILKREDAFLLSDVDAKIYYAECYAARDAAKLRVAHAEECPLSVAESVRIEAEFKLMREMSKAVGCEALGMRVCPSDLHNNAVDLMLKLLAPFCRDAEAILGAIAVAPGNT